MSEHPELPEWQARLAAVASLAAKPEKYPDGEVRCINPYRTDCGNTQLNRADVTCWKCGGDWLQPMTEDLIATRRVPPPLPPRERELTFQEYIEQARASVYRIQPQQTAATAGPPWPNCPCPQCDAARTGKDAAPQPRRSVPARVSDWLDEHPSVRALAGACAMVGSGWLLAWAAVSL